MKRLGKNCSKPAHHRHRFLGRFGKRREKKCKPRGDASTSTSAGVSHLENAGEGEEGAHNTRRGHRIAFLSLAKGGLGPKARQEEGLGIAPRIECLLSGSKNKTLVGEIDEDETGLA